MGKASRRAHRQRKRAMLRKFHKREAEPAALLLRSRKIRNWQRSTLANSRLSQRIEWIQQVRTAHEKRGNIHVAGLLDLGAGQCRSLGILPLWLRCRSSTQPRKRCRNEADPRGTHWVAIRHLGL